MLLPGRWDYGSFDGTRVSVLVNPPPPFLRNKKQRIQKELEAQQYELIEKFHLTAVCCSIRLLDLCHLHSFEQPTFG